MYSSKLSISVRFSVSFNKILYVFFHDLSTWVCNTVKEAGKVNLPGTFKLLAFVTRFFHETYSHKQKVFQKISNL